MVWRFEEGEDLRQAFCRVAEEEIARVRAGLAAEEADRSKAIHMARQGFKRLRALARLARPTLRRRFAAENRRWRDAGRLLSGSRDRTVLMESFDNLMTNCSVDLPASAIRSLRNRILEGAAVPAPSETDAKVEQVIGLIDKAAKDLATLNWPKSSEALVGGFHRSQRELRKSWKKARKEGSPEALHDWRKRVKDQSAQLRLFRNIVPDALKALREDAKKTAEYLGEEHDLWMLSSRLSEITAPPRKARDLLLKAVEERRAVLRRKAFELGERFSSNNPKAFAREVGEAWEAASPTPSKKPRRKKPRSVRPAPGGASTSQAG
jgi:CHAD domain-containing protein